MQDPPMKALRRKDVAILDIFDWRQIIAKNSIRSREYCLPNELSKLFLGNILAKCTTVIYKNSANNRPSDNISDVWFAWNNHTALLSTSSSTRAWRTATSPTESAQQLRQFFNVPNVSNVTSVSAATDVYKSVQQITVTTSKNTYQDKASSAASSWKSKTVTTKYKMLLQYKSVGDVQQAATEGVRKRCALRYKRISKRGYLRQICIFIYTRTYSYIRMRWKWIKMINILLEFVLFVCEEIESKN